MDIDDIDNSSLEYQPPIVDFNEQDKQIPPQDSFATIDDKQTSPHVSHPPNVALDEHDIQVPLTTIDNKQTSPNDSQPPIQQNLSSEKNSSKAPEQFQPSLAFSNGR